MYLYFNFPDNLGDHAVPLKILQKVNCNNIDGIICSKNYEFLFKFFFKDTIKIIYKDAFLNYKIKDLYILDFVLYDEDVEIIKKNIIENIYIYPINKYMLYNKTSYQLKDHIFCLKNNHDTRDIERKIIELKVDDNTNLYNIYESIFSIFNYDKKVKECKSPNHNENIISVCLTSKSNDKMINPNIVVHLLKERVNICKNHVIFFIDNSNYTRDFLKKQIKSFNYKIIDNSPLNKVLNYIKKSNIIFCNDSGILHLSNMFDDVEKYVFINKERTSQKNMALNSLFWMPNKANQIILDSEYFGKSDNIKESEISEILKGI